MHNHSESKSVRQLTQVNQHFVLILFLTALCAIWFFVSCTTILYLTFFSSSTTPPSPTDCLTKSARGKMPFTTINDDTQHLTVPSVSPSLESKTSDRSSTVSAGSLDPWSLERYINPKQSMPIKHQQDRPQVLTPEVVELASYVSQKDRNYPEWAGSLQSTLVNEASVSPVVPVSTMPPNSSQTSAQRNLTNLPASESIREPPNAYGKWEKIRDPAALLGLSHPFCGTGNLAKGSQLVGLEGKFLHAIFDKLDLVSATCK